MLASKQNLNLEDIAQSCGIYDVQDINGVISKIDSLRIKYQPSDLINIFNYLLSKSQNPDVTMYLIRCHDEYRDSPSLPFLVDILLLDHADNESEDLKEKYTNVRIMSAKAIGNLKNTDAVTSLLYCLNNKNENYRVRLACADSLGHIGDKYAVAPLIELAKDENEKSVYLREGAVSALGVLGDLRAVDPLVSILETKQGIMSKFSFLKECVIEALNKMGIGKNDRVFRALKSSLLDESPQVRINAIEALMNGDYPQAYEIIKNVLENDSDKEVKKNALIALYNLSGRGILDEVIASDKYSDALKMSAVKILDEYENDSKEGEDND